MNRWIAVGFVTGGGVLGWWAVESNEPALAARFTSSAIVRASPRSVPRARRGSGEPSVRADVTAIAPTGSRFEAFDGTASDAFGYALSGAGDVDGDGYADVLVGAYKDSDAATNAGSAYVFTGSRDGIDATAGTKLLAPSPAASEAFGVGVAAAGDLNGDGFDDVLVGAYGGGSYSGAAYTFYGKAGGLDAVATPLRAGDAGAGAFFGYAVAGAGDVDGDGFDDVIVGAYGDAHLTGAAYVYRGGSAGPDSGSEEKLVASDAARGDYFGRSVHGAGDVDGDGYADVVIGAFGDADTGSGGGSAWIFYGASGGIGVGAGTRIPAADDDTGDTFGWSVAGAGDVDGDGYPDVIVGAPGGSTGFAYLFAGGAAGLDSSPLLRLAASDGKSSDQFGESVTAAGDVNGDGFGDIAVGADGADDNGSSSGAAYLYFGSSSGIDPSKETKLAPADGAADDHFGYAVAGAADVDADGFDDAVVGAYGDDDRGSQAGSAYLFPGACTDGDGDGSCVDDDCDDTNASVFPGAAEVVGDDLDEDCDGMELCHADADGDGYTPGGDALPSADADCADPGEADASVPDGDCDDADATFYPGAPEDDPSTPGDRNCDGWVAWPDVDDDGYTTHDDCDDGDPGVHPGARESCNGIDDDCDGASDEADAVDVATWYPDGDGDGYGDPTRSVGACDAPGGYVSEPGDCDDEDDAVHPGATESCDGVDNDCDGTSDGEDATDLLEWYADRDGDGYGTPDSSVRACAAPAGYAARATDCDDGSAGVFPGAAESCDGIDDDCDGSVDETDATDATTWYSDEDADSFGDATHPATACAAPDGFVSAAGDCDDGDATIHPTAEERCDGVDDDCDGATDEDDAVDATMWFADADGDEYGDSAHGLAACLPPEDHVADDTDCDDADALVSPGAAERCDGVDDDCDGLTDEVGSTDAASWYVDADGDGYGGAERTTACDAPAGFVATVGDCDDTAEAVHPGAAERCDGVDDDCDGATDEDDADDASTWYLDADGDSAGDPTRPASACTAPVGWVASPTDCDDADDAVHPGGDDPPGDGVDADCDGVDGAGGEGCSGCPSDASPVPGGMALLAGIVLLDRRRRACPREDRR